jgi:hypothetical protein
MAKKIKYNVSMKDGSTKEVEGTTIVENYAYDKRELYNETVTNSKGESKVVRTYTYVLTHVPTGTLITSADKVNSLKLLCAEPEFFDEFNPQALIKAVYRFWNKHNWQDPKVGK